MVAHFKTELWLSKTGQVAQFDPDYSLCSNARSSNSNWNNKRYLKMYLLREMEKLEEIKPA